jgi:vacuolar-type H+-ATPase subunit E/Vma4
MTIEAIIDKINKETSENINKILKASKQESQKVHAKAKSDLDRELLQEQKKSEKNIEITRNIHLSNARRIARRSVLGKKEELINECFSQAKAQLKELSGDEYRTTIRKLITEGVKLIGTEAVAIPSKDEDLAIIKEFSNLTLSNERTGAIGGVILRSKDGKTVVNNTFDAILERYKDDIRTEVANALFSEGE